MKHMASNTTSLIPDIDLQHALSLHQSGQWADAARQYIRLLKFSPDNTLLLTNLAAVKQKLGEPEESIRLVEMSLKHDPAQPLALFLRGMACHMLNRLNEALASFDRAIALKPDHALAFHFRSIVFQKLGRLGEALESCNRAIALKPGHAESHIHRASILATLNRPTEALVGFDRAISLKPDRALPYVYRAAVLHSLHQSELAIASCDRAIAIQPDCDEAYINRAVILQDLKRFDEALACYDQIIALNPDHAGAYWNKSNLLLLAGDYEQGWRLHEWRNRIQISNRNYPQPLWLGEHSVAGKTLLIHAEGGLGDIIQKCRYASLAANQGARVIFEVPKSLARLLSTMKCDCTIVEKGKPLPSFDLHTPSMSLPLAFGTTLETIPTRTPYLYSETEKQKLWQRKLGSKTKPRVGLVWSGTARSEIDSNPARIRNIPLHMLEPLLQLPIEFHSLHKSIRPEDAAALSRFSQIQQHHDELEDFSDTAALLGEMDLVISIDTSVAHLAGALGQPVWVMLPYSSDYRWTLDGTTTPWYPTATLFRQSAQGGWPEVISTIKGKLQQANFTPQSHAEPKHH